MYRRVNWNEAFHFSRRFRRFFLPDPQTSLPPRLAWRFICSWREGDGVNRRKALLRLLPACPRIRSLLPNPIVLQLSPSLPSLPGVEEVTACRPISQSEQLVRGGGKMGRCGNSCLRQTAEEPDYSPNKCFVPSMQPGPSPRPATD